MLPEMTYGQSFLLPFVKVANIPASQSNCQSSSVQAWQGANVEVSLVSSSSRAESSEHYEPLGNREPSLVLRDRQPAECDFGHCRLQCIVMSEHA